MNIPEKAIICTPTYEDAVKLDKFMREHTNRWVPLDSWCVHKEETCWDLCEEDSDHRLIYMSHAEYDSAIEEYESCGDHESYIPAEPEWRFVTVDEFIMICVGCCEPEDSDFDIGELL